MINPLTPNSLEITSLDRVEVSSSSSSSSQNTASINLQAHISPLDSVEGASLKQKKITVTSAIIENAISELTCAFVSPDKKILRKMGVKI